MRVEHGAFGERDVARGVVTVVRANHDMGNRLVAELRHRIHEPLGFFGASLSVGNEDTVIRDDEQSLPS